MPKIQRKLFKPFATNAAIDEISQIGSLRAGAPTFSKDPDVIQALANNTDGWFAIAMGENSPAMEDMNAIQFLFAYMISYILESGVPEWNAGTTYYADSMIRDSNGNILSSFINNNISNSPNSKSHWHYYGNKVRKITDDNTEPFWTILPSDNIVLIESTVLNQDVYIELPLSTDVPMGKEITVKNVSTLLGTRVFLSGNGVGIDGSTNVQFSPIEADSSMWESITVFLGPHSSPEGAMWYVK